MKTIGQYIHELFQPWIEKSEELINILNDKNVQETIDLARSYVERGENGMARFIADLLNEHYRTDIFTELCLKNN